MFSIVMFDSQSVLSHLWQQPLQLFGTQGLTPFLAEDPDTATELHKKEPTDGFLGDHMVFWGTTEDPFDSPGNGAKKNAWHTFQWDNIIC